MFHYIKPVFLQSWHKVYNQKFTVKDFYQFTFNFQPTLIVFWRDPSFIFIIYVIANYEMLSVSYLYISFVYTYPSIV